MLSWLFARLPTSLQIFLDFEGSKLEILRVLGSSRIDISVPEIASGTRFGVDYIPPLYPYVHRLVREGLVRETAATIYVANNTSHGDRQRLYYRITQSGREVLARLNNLQTVEANTR